MIISIVLCVVSHFALMIYYIIHVVNHPPRSEGEKIMWILLFIFIGSLAFLVYFFIRVVPMPARRPQDELQGIRPNI